MNILKSIIISLSLYSKIPMPTFEWDEDSTRHAISFLPLTGLIIGGISALFAWGAMQQRLPVFFVTLMLTAIPLIVTGGFHVDGFMDVQDALHSYQPKEKKLEIMKDPHIGAFAVISAGTVLMIWTGFLYLLVNTCFEKRDLTFLMIFALAYVLIRALCGITSISFPKAKKDGMLNMETGKSNRGDLIFLSLEALLSLGAMVAVHPCAGIVEGAAALLFTLWYRELCKKNFGGVTGDTAGFFVVMGEMLLVVVLGAAGFIL